MTKSSIWGSIALVVLLAGLFGVRSHYLAQRDTCGRRLTAIVPQLASYANAHRGQLPATFAALERALGQKVPTSTLVAQPGQMKESKLARFRDRMAHSATQSGVPFQMAAHPLRWKDGAPQPYLWDAYPHDYVNGVHVLYSDGSVKVEDVVPN